MVSKVYSSALYGIEAYRVTVETHVGRGIGFFLSGLPDDAVKECRSRIEIALQSNGFEMPRTKLSINMAPADVRKMGTGYDLPVALGILMASGQLQDLGKLADYMVVGELGLDGCIYGVRGALSMAIRARQEGFSGILVPAQNAAEAALVDGIQVFGVPHFSQLIDFLACDAALKPACQEKFSISPPAGDFREVKGQVRVKRGLEIAAAGGHNCLVMGPPGIGKTMLAKRLPSILPPMTAEEALETTRIYTACQNTAFHGLISERPFRSPHHTISDVALAGGGPLPGPGEISLAHNGVLFLDELPEFRRSVIEVLRQPLEEKKITIARARGILELPASFMLLAAMNPCICGYHGHPARKCTCSKRALYWYRRKISGPLLDRIDLHIEAEPVTLKEMMESNEIPESSAIIRERVMKARKLQLQRFHGSAIRSNALIPDQQLEAFCPIETHARKFLIRMIDDFEMSPRSYSRILKLARTIADLGQKEMIELPHVAEALHFRSLDKPLQVNKVAINSV